jgi:hypothetical protein
MNWNIFKRVTELEQKVKDLTDFNNDNSLFIGQLKGKINQINNKLFIQAVEHKAFSVAPVRNEGQPVFTKSEVNLEKERRRLYQREWRAKNKLNKEARDKKNAYARAYYARTKGKKK